MIPFPTSILNKKTKQNKPKSGVVLDNELWSGHSTPYGEDGGQKDFSFNTSGNSSTTFSLRRDTDTRVPKYESVEHVQVENSIKNF